MKATLSKDGQYRFTMLVPFRAGRLELIHSVQITLGIDQQMPSSRSEILRYLKQNLAHHGVHLWSVAEDYPKTFDDASSLVDKYFPELRTVKS